MTSTTTILSLPLMSPSQAQKTVTHNEALVQLDAMVQLSVLDRTRTAPPSSPVLGQTHLVAASATGAWAGRDRQLAVWNGTAWEFHTALTGWRAYVQAEAVVASYNGTAWFTESDVAHTYPQLGINGASDATNRLMVRGPASLFQGDTAGHQMKINKIGNTATASLALQTGFATRAEIGLVGNNDLTLKVSPDGSSFIEGMVVDGTSGHVTVKQGLNLLPAAGDPASPANGDLWYNSSTGKFRGRQGGGNIDLALGGSSSFSAATFTVQDGTDATKKLQFQLSGLTTGTTRTISVPNMSGMLAIFANFAARAAALTWQSSENQPDGTVITVAGLAFRKKSGGTAIADMPNWLPALEVYADHFGENSVPGTTDMSAAIQAALTYVGGLGGGEVRLGQGIYIAKGLNVPNQTYVVGQGIDSTTLKLKNAANTWLLASTNYGANQTFANLYGGTRDLTMDGNKANNATGSLVWFCSYRAKFIRTRFANSGAAGLVLTAIMADGTTFLANHMAENQVLHCHFDGNVTHGLWAKDGAADRTSDAEVMYSHFFNNGGAGIYAERCNGWKITNNQIYLSGTHCIYVNQLARTVISGNHLDLIANTATAASRNACIYVDVISSQGAWVISGNIFLVNDLADSAGLVLNGLAIMSASVDPAMIGGNSFADMSVAQGGAELFLNAAASASLAKSKWLVEAQGPGKVVQSLTATDSGFVLQDNTDATKKAQFELSGLTTATTRTFTLPDASTSLAGLGVLQTFTIKQTFAGSNNDFGVSALSGTINLASGVAASGNTKTVNIGTGGASGSTTAVAIGSASAGAGGSLTINSPTVGFGATVTAFNIPDSVFTLQDNGDATKKAQFELSGITTATTRTYTLPNASGSVVLDSATQTLTNKSIVATQLTGPLQAAQEPAHTGDVTNTAGSLAMTIAAGAVSLSKLANLTASTILGNNTGAAAVPLALTGTQVTAMLDGFTSALKGVVPSSGGGTANFLRADGSWAAPAGGGGVTDGDKGDVVVSATGTVWSLDYPAVNAVVAPVWSNITAKPTTVAGYAIADAVTTAGAQTVAGVKTLSDPLMMTGQTSDPAGPANGTIWFDSQMMTQKVTIGGRNKDLFADLVAGPYVWKATPGGATIATLGLGGPTAVGTATLANIATTNKFTMMPRLEYLVTTASTTAVAGFRGTAPIVAVGGTAADLGGFRCTMVWGPATGVATTTNRAFAGLTNNTAAPTDVEPSTQTLVAGMGWNAADTNIQMMFNDASGTCTKVDLGGSFAVPTADRTSLYKLEMYSPKGTTQSVQWRVTDLVSGAVAQGTQTTDLPTTTSLLVAKGWMSVGGTSSVIGFSLTSVYLDPLM